MLEPRKIGTVPPLVLELDHDLVCQLRPHARARDISVLSLVHQLIDAVVEDGLINAVLDDADAEP